MNRELLLAHFDRISDAPGAISQLRRFILDLAVWGKLVEQNPKDEIASDLLKNVKQSKVQMLLEKPIRGEQSVEHSSPKTKRGLPSTWLWACVDDVAIVQGGKRLPNGTTFSKEPTVHIYIRVTDMKNGTINRDDLRYITPEVHRPIARYTISRCDLYITIAGTIGQVGRVPDFFDGQNLTENAAKIVFRGLNPDYLRMALSSEVVQEQFRDKTKQMAQPKLALKRILGIKFPLPPLAEQHRIVAKVEDLMNLCDQLEAAKTEREARRDRLAAASNHHLNNGADAESFRKGANFYINHLPTLTTSGPRIQQLRQTTLNLAVRGRLVPQDGVEEDARQLILSINAERERRIHIGQLKRTSPLKVTGNEKSFDYSVPPRWIFCFVDDFAIKVTDGEHATPMRCQSGDYLLSARNVTNRGIDVSDVDFVPREEYVRIRKRCDPDKGDILISCSGSVGRVAVVDRDDTYTMVRSAALIKLDDSLISSKYIAYALRADPAQEQIALYSKSTAQANLFIGPIRKLRIPLPPLGEQRRIVAKVDEVMALCDRLEVQIANAKTETSRLLESVLYHALASSGIDPKASGPDLPASDLPSATLKHALIM